jgi:hypothetical protein
VSIAYRCNTTIKQKQLNSLNNKEKIPSQKRNSRPVPGISFLRG